MVGGWRVKKKLLDRKILSVMKLEGGKWRGRGTLFLLGLFLLGKMEEVFGGILCRQPSAFIFFMNIRKVF